MLNQNFDILAAALALIGAVNYAWATFKGSAQPNRVSWLLWTITPSISFAVELAQHVHLDITLLTLSEAIGPLLVVSVSLKNKKAYWKASVFDWCCGAISIVAVALWLITGQGNLALIFSLIASFASAIPTIIKSYAHPKTESPWDYVASVVAGAITLLTIQHWTLGNYGFPAYIIIESTLIAFLVLTPGRMHEQTTVSDTATVEPALEPATILSLGSVSWSQNPTHEGESTVLSVSASATNGIIQAEYIGSIDPGLGNGFPMAIQGATLTVTFSATVPSGTYPISIRAKDTSDHWSDLVLTSLVVI